jgi:hypothetical protein
MPYYMHDDMKNAPDPRLHPAAQGYIDGWNAAMNFMAEQCSKATLKDT